MTESEFTFFPYKNEAEMIAGSSAADIARFITHDPSMGARFMHEMLRTGRKDDCYYALSQARLNANAIDVIFLGLSEAAAMMCAMHNVSEPEAVTYINESVDLIFKAEAGIPLDQPLNGKFAVIADIMKKRRIEKAQEYIQIYKARMT